MMNLIRLTFCVLSVATVYVVNACDNKTKHNICYYTSWGGTMPDANLCTMVIYSFADMSGGVLSGVWGNPLQGLKNQNPNLKILVAVGGWNFGVSRMTEMLATEQTRQKFADHAVGYLRSLGFDGLDLDYEYPGTNYPEYGRYSPPEDKQRFTLLCQQLRDAFEAEAAQTGKERLLLTVAFGCRKPDIDAGYEIDKLAQSIDYFNLMTYDLRGGFDSIASHHSALYAGDYETGLDRVFNSAWAVDYFIGGGAPPEKIILGLASYGKSFRWHSQPYELGKSAVFADWHGYGDVCNRLKSGWKREWIDEQKVPVAVSGNVVIGYDDVESVRIKTEYVIQKGLGGAMWWSLDHDDTWGSCGQGRFPLINTVNQVYKENTDCPGVTSSGITSRRTTTTPTTTKGSQTSTNTQDTTKVSLTTTASSVIDESRYDCSSGKQFAKHPDDCTKLIRCDDKKEIQCPSDLRFNFELQICDWPYNVICTTLPPTTATTTVATTTIPANTTSISTNTTTTEETKICEDGMHPHPYECDKYIICYNNEIKIQTCRKLSTIQLLYDAEAKICDLPSRAKTVEGCV